MCFLSQKYVSPLVCLVFTIVWGFCFQKIMLLVRCEHACYIIGHAREHSCCYIIGHAHPYS